MIVETKTENENLKLPFITENKPEFEIFEDQHQAFTDGLSSICPHVHLRPRFYISECPSPEYVHEIDGLSSFTVRLRPYRKNNHGLSSEFVHEVNSRSSSGRPTPAFYGK